MSNKTSKNIEDINIGDSVLSEDSTGKQSISIVTNTYHPISNNLCTIKYTDGEQLQVTKGHPLFTQNGWKAIDTNVAALEDPGVPVSTLNIGDFMKKDTGTWKQISNIGCVDETVQTYNLTVDNNHDYYAGGFLAHNKGAWCPGIYGTKYTEVNGTNLTTGAGSDQTVTLSNGWYTNINPYSFWLNQDCRDRTACWPYVLAGRISAGYYSETVTAPANYNVYYNINGAAYGAGFGSGTTTVNFFCGAASAVSVDWYFTPQCDPNSWGAWGACSVTCGGGTQSRTNACGTVQTQSCNTQSCVIPAWWQVKDADIAANGNLQSTIPTSQFFDLPGDGGYPGVPAYSGTSNLTLLNVSAKGWLANSTEANAKIFNYQYFANQVPANTTINTISNPSIGQTELTGGQADASTGYYWYKYDGSTNGHTPLTISSPVNVGSHKVILLVYSANLDINSDINLTKGQGFFMTIVGTDATGNGGNITVGTGVGGGGAANLEGMYIADGTFSDGTLQPGSNDSQLRVRGNVVAYGSVSLQRDLGGITNFTTPAEYFEYAPDQMMLFPSKLGYRKISWKEVAP